MTIHGVPRLPPSLVARERITQRLESPAAIVVAHAPSGFGKTVALTQWAHGTAREGRTGPYQRIRTAVNPRAPIPAGRTGPRILVSTTRT